jgi:hypothetical protein
VKAAWEIRAKWRRMQIAWAACDIARAARMAGESIDIEGWVRSQAARQPDSHMRALLLATVAKELSKAQRIPGAVALIWDAVFEARQASRDCMLEILTDAAPVLEAAEMRSELVAVTRILEELRPWCTSEQSAFPRSLSNSHQSKNAAL